MTCVRRLFARFFSSTRFVEVPGQPAFSVPKPKKQKHRFLRAIKADKVDLEDYAKIIRSLALVRPPRELEIENVLGMMRQAGISLTDGMIVDLITACANSKPAAVEKAELLVSKLDERGKVNEQSLRGMLQVYSRASEPQIDNAQTVFDELRARGQLAKDASDFDTLISACARAALPSRAESLVAEMKAAGREPSLRSLNGIVLAYANVDPVDVERVERAARAIDTHRFKWNRVTFEALLRAYSRASPPRDQKIAELTQLMQNLKIPTENPPKK